LGKSCVSSILIYLPLGKNTASSTMVSTNLKSPAITNNGTFKTPILMLKLNVI
jgi:hypothetical protein